MSTQAERATRFEALHQRGRAFIIPNPWDAGSARILEGLGYEALATTSSGFALTTGRKDYGVTREAVLDHVAALTSATSLPVSADLENGFGDAPEVAAETIRLGAQAGLVGGSIEDTRREPGRPLYELEHAAERVRAAAEAAHALSFPFTLTARAENFLVGRDDLEDTIRRLQAFEEAGADVLYAPGLSTEEQIRAVVAAVDRPVNVIVLAGMQLTLEDFSRLGVRRLSVGGGLARIAYGALVREAKQMFETGTFGYAERAISGRELGRFLA